jgi:putative heme degradation protein
MSVKTTRRITREAALHLIARELEQQPSNKVLEDILDAMADSEQSKVVSVFDNFIVSDVPDSPGE